MAKLTAMGAMDMMMMKATTMAGKTVVDVDILQSALRPTHSCSFICSQNFPSQLLTSQSSLRYSLTYSLS